MRWWIVYKSVSYESSLDSDAFNMSCIFYIFSIFVFIAITDVHCCVLPTHTVHNCTNGTLYTRKPTEKNNYTSYWCLIIHTSLPSIKYNNISTSAAEFCKTRYGEAAVVTIPENAEEIKSIQQRYQLWMNRYNLTIPIWTIYVDGKLKPSCSPIGSCSPSNSYEMSNIQTDPTVIMNHWKNGQPDNRTSNDVEKSCLGIDQDGFLRNIFCELESSPFNGADGNPEYEVHGLLCGAKAIPYVIPGYE